MTNRLPFLQPTELDAASRLFVRPMPRRWRLRHSVRFALQGLRDAWESQPNLRMHIWMGLGMVALGVSCRLSLTEWLWVSFAIGLVIFAELMNTAIEQTVDLVVGLRPDPLARQVKDVAAGCVLAAACLAVVIGALTFLPYLLAFTRVPSGT